MPAAMISVERGLGTTLPPRSIATETVIKLNDTLTDIFKSMRLVGRDPATRPSVFLTERDAVVKQGAHVAATQHPLQSVFKIPNS